MSGLSLPYKMWALDDQNLCRRFDLGLGQDHHYGGALSYRRSQTFSLRPNIIRLSPELAQGWPNYLRQVMGIRQMGR